jgi:hypothetical protein
MTFPLGVVKKIEGFERDFILSKTLSGLGKLIIGWFLKVGLRFKDKSSAQSPPQKNTDQYDIMMSNQLYLDCVGKPGKLEFIKLLIFKSMASLMTKFNPPNEEMAGLFSIFISVFVSITNLGENTLAVKL